MGQVTFACEDCEAVVRRHRKPKDPRVCFDCGVKRAEANARREHKRYLARLQRQEIRQRQLTARVVKRTPVKAPRPPSTDIRVTSRRGAGNTLAESLADVERRRAGGATIDPT